ncbi:MAG: DUF3565 domain-containing protein [Gammaproteobacteria bacterium]
MKRPITGFHIDEAGDWVADLDCGHGQHVRHRPPFIERPWTQGEAGRASMLGSTLDCVRCDRLEFPDGFECYKRTPEFDQDTTPAGLRANHTTKAGVWGRIVVVAGALRYVVEPPVGCEFILDPAHPGTVSPGIAHRVEPLGAVRFLVEFHRRRPEPEPG